MSKWRLYILECSDSSLYTGITTDLDKRIKRHNEGRATKYTRIRKPVKLVYTELCGTECRARQREIEVKKLSRKKKLELINTKFFPSHS
jgi:putative endonuclease